MVAHHQMYIERYKVASNQAALQARCERIQKMVLTLLRRDERVLNVADIGCNLGTQCQLWAKQGHRAYGLDISAELVQLARERARDANLPISFEIGSATNIPWPAESMDVVIAAELLEHVVDWQRCLKEFVRILRPGGVLYLTTTNVLHPRQSEIALPLYSWYPSPIKRYCERIAATTHPQLVSYNKYPPLHWFTYHGLSRYMKEHGFTTFNRVDLVERMDKTRSRGTRLALKAIQFNGVTKLLAQFMEENTWVIAVKERSA